MTKNQEQNIIEFLGKGYNSESTPPPKDIKIKIIDKKFDSYEGYFFDDNLFEYESGFVARENVLAWKHIAQ